MRDLYSSCMNECLILLFLIYWITSDVLFFIYVLQHLKIASKAGKFFSMKNFTRQQSNSNKNPGTLWNEHRRKHSWMDISTSAQYRDRKREAKLVISELNNNKMIFEEVPNFCKFFSWKLSRIFFFFTTNHMAVCNSVYTYPRQTTCLFFFLQLKTVVPTETPCGNLCKLNSEHFPKPFCADFNTSFPMFTNTIKQHAWWIRQERNGDRDA